MRLRLRVKPGARKSGIVGVHGGALKIAVKAPPEKGKANDAVIALLAETLHIAESAVSIVAGAASQDKVAVVTLQPDELISRLARAGITSAISPASGFSS